MLIEQVAEKFFGKSTVGFGLERLFHLAEQGHIGQRCLAEDRFAGLNVSLSERLAIWSDHRVALLDAEQAEENGRVNRGKKRVDFETQFLRQAAKIGAAALIHEDFQKTGHAAGSRVGKHDGLWPPGSAGSVDAGRNNLAFVIGLREDAINRINQLDE